jgi:hypothetical protein
MRLIHEKKRNLLGAIGRSLMLFIKDNTINQSTAFFTLDGAGHQYLTFQ